MTPPPDTVRASATGNISSGGPSRPNILTPATPPKASGSRIDPAGSLKKHPILALVVMVLVAAASIPVAFIKGKAAYSAMAVVFVSPRFQANLQDAKEFELQSNSQYREYVQQQVRTINRFDIVRDSLHDLGPLRKVMILPGETERHAVERLQGALEISPVPDTYQITVGIEGPQKEGLAELVNGVVKTFLERAKVEEFYAVDQRLQNLDTDRVRLQEEIEQKQARRTEIAQELGVTTFTENYVNPYDKLLVDAKEGLAAATRSRIEAQAQVDAVDAARRPTSGKALQAYALDMASKDPALTSLQSNLNQRRSTLLTAASGLQADHPGRRAAEREIAELEKERDRVYQSLLKEYGGMIVEQRRADFFKTAQIEEKLKQQVEAQASQASWFTVRYQEGRTLGFDIDRARKRQDSIEERVGFLSLERRAPGFVRLFSEARTPEQPVRGGKKKFLLIGMAAGLLLGLFAPIAVDFLDPRIHIPGDVEKILGFATMGWLLRKDQAGPDFSHEQMMRLAGRVSQEQQANGSRIFAFTSVAAGGGTTSIVTELARALTSVGVHTLAVEANAYRSDPRYRDPRSRGLTVVLRGGEQLESAIVPGTEDLPDHIPVGDVKNPTTLPDILNLISVLEAATHSYQAILIDLPPLLVSVDAEMIARAADVAVLVVEAEVVNRADLEKAARMLERLNPRAVGAILNKVHSEAGGGFGKQAVAEFGSGARPGPSRWTTPWLWR